MIGAVHIGQGLRPDTQLDRLAIEPFQGGAWSCKGKADFAALIVDRVGINRIAVDPDGSVDKVHRRRAHKGRHKQVRGRVVDVFRCAKLLHIAAVHHCDAGGQRHRLDLVVGHIDNGGAKVLVQLLDLGPHVDTQLGVEVRQRLVEQEHVRVAHQRAAHRHPLPLTARQCAGLAVQELFDLQQLGHIMHRLFALGLGCAMHLKTESDVLADGHVRVEGVGLEHHCDVALGWMHAVHGVALDRNGAAGDVLKPRDHVQQRGLATARGADEDQKFALFDRDVDLVQHLDGAVGLGCVVDIEKAHGSYPLTEPAIRPRTK